jgi:hypothetical protein
MATLRVGCEGESLCQVVFLAPAALRQLPRAVDRFSRHTFGNWD